MASYYSHWYGELLQENSLYFTPDWLAGGDAGVAQVGPKITLWQSGVSLAGDLSKGSKASAPETRGQGITIGEMRSWQTSRFVLTVE